VVGRAAFAFERDFLAAIDLFLVFGCFDRFVSVAAPFAASLTRRTRPAKIDTRFLQQLGTRPLGIHRHLGAVQASVKCGTHESWNMSDA
jgi:hypothetical protein